MVDDCMSPSHQTAAAAALENGVRGDAHLEGHPQAEHRGDSWELD